MLLFTFCPKIMLCYYIDKSANASLQNRFFSVPHLQTTKSKMAEFDLTSQMGEYLDRHLVFPLLEFLSVKEVINTNSWSSILAYNSVNVFE